jgi:hypothetical protein
MRKFAYILPVVAVLLAAGVLCSGLSAAFASSDLPAIPSVGTSVATTETAPASGEWTETSAPTPKPPPGPPTPPPAKSKKGPK